MASLFDEFAEFDRKSLARRVKACAEQRILLGGSSWKYPGWIGQIYSRSRYESRGRFSKKLFENTCLAEYAETFPTVCGDFAFYQFPSDDFWRKLFHQVPEGFQFAFKVPEQITCPIFPSHPRYGGQGGTLNASFLDGDLFREGFVRALEPYRGKTGLLIFEFGAFAPRAFARPAEFLDRLDPFLSSLPDGFRYAVEIRNAGFLVPDYFACLHSHNVAHVYNAWTKMPALQDQFAIPDSRTADFLVTRALLREGRAYEDAVRLFSPYEEVREPLPDVRKALRELIQISREERKTSFLFVNNRLEGNAPGTMVSILDD